jgi:hypothetical protein
MGAVEQLLAPRLFERLREGRGRRLSLVECPAGFGKSTLLAAWRDDESRERPVDPSGIMKMHRALSVLRGDPK